MVRRLTAADVPELYADPNIRWAVPLGALIREWEWWPDDRPAIVADEPVGPPKRQGHMSIEVWGRHVGTGKHLNTLGPLTSFFANNQHPVRSSILSRRRSHVTRWRERGHLRGKYQHTGSSRGLAWTFTERRDATPSAHYTLLTSMFEA